MAVIRGSKGQALVLLTIAFVVTMDGLDTSIVNVALPSIASSYCIDTSTVAWVSMTYLIMMTGLILVFSKLADRGMIKKVLISGLILFSVSSLACGLSSTFEMLLACRVFQGIGAAAMGACAPLICVRFLPANKLGLGMSVVTLGASVGVALGPAIGGILAEYLSWHWIFFINVPIGIAVILFSLRSVPNDETRTDSHFDAMGASLIMIAVSSGVFAMERFAHVGLDNSLVRFSAVVCVATFVLFIAWERKCRDPMLDLGIFRSWEFDSVLTVFLIINIVTVGSSYLLPFYLDLGMGFDSATTGMYLFIPSLVTLMICVPVSRWSDRTGRRWFCVASCAVLTIYSSIYFVIDPSMGLVPLVIALVMLGIVWGVCGGPAASRIIEVVKEKEKGTASALLFVSGYLGATIGTTLFASLFSITTGSGNTPFADLQLPTFMIGFHASMLFGAAFAAIAVALSAIVRDKKSNGTE